MADDPPRVPPALAPQQSVRALDESDRALKIPIDVLYESFSCPICINVLREVHMTPCGHNFCNSCIRECLNLKHVCPLCNAPTLAEQLVRNHALDGMLQAVSQARQQAQADYIASLTQAAPAGALSAVEAVFRRRSRDALLGFQAYLAELERGTEAAVARRPADEAALRARHQRSVDALVADFEAHLDAVAPAAFLVPSSVAIRVPSRQLRFVAPLRPTHYADDVLELVKARLAGMGDEVREVAPGWSLSLRDVDEGGGEAVPLPDADRPLFEQAPGGRVDGAVWQLVLEAELLCRSDLPRPCFTQEYEAGSGQRVDYSSCATCGINWVCEACRDTCHAGHELAPYIQQHEPTYACCYCVKKRKCKIVQKKK